MENTNIANVTKHLIMAEGMDVPEVEFSFEAKKITEDAPEASIESVTYDTSDSKGDLAKGCYVLDKEADISFGAFPHAGLYEYKVTETEGSQEGITYDDASYTMKVYVANDGNGDLKVKSVTAEKEGAKQDELAFENIYRGIGNLTVSKKTEGEFADKTKDFTFSITFTKCATEDDSVTEYTGKIGTKTVACRVGEKTSFQLHDGESLVFDSLPVGTRYVVEEEGAKDGYTPSVSVVENDVWQTNPRTAAEDAALASADTGSTNLVGERTNEVIFTNTYPEIPATGLILEQMPFILLIGLPILLLLIPTVIKARMKRHRRH